MSLQPVEIAKTRIQLSHAGDSSTLTTLVDIVRSDGVPGLFRGVGAKSFETGAKNFVYFYIYDVINTSAKKVVPITTVVKLVLGYLAGVGTTCTTMPLEVLSTKVQAETKAGAGALITARGIIEKEGLSGLFKGFWYNIILCVNPAIQNTCFDRMKDVILKAMAAAGNKRPALTLLQAFVLGAIAKAIATIITYPLVRLKTILQAGHEKDVQPAAKPPVVGDQLSELGRVASTSEMLGEMAVRRDKQSKQHPNLAELYRGLGSALMKSVLQAALLYMTKDQVEDTVRMSFRLTSKALFGKDGRLKLGVISGRPLPS